MHLRFLENHKEKISAVMELEKIIMRREDKDSV